MKRVTREISPRVSHSFEPPKIFRQNNIYEGVKNLKEWKLEKVAVKLALRRYLKE